MDPETDVTTTTDGEGADTAALSMDDALRESIAELDKAGASDDDAGGTAAAASASTADAGRTAPAATAEAGKGGEPAAGTVDAQGRARGADGKFVAAKDGAAAPAAAAAATQPDAKKPDAAVAAAKSGQDAPAAGAADAAAAAAPQPELVDGRDITKAPKSWKADAAAGFDKLPKPMREEIHRREEAMFKGIEQYKGAATFGVEMAKVCHPYQQMFTAIGTSPAKLMDAAVGFEYGIRTAPSVEKKFEILSELAKGYGVELISARPYIAAVGGAKDGARPDPRVMSLETELNALKQRETERERVAREAQEASDREATETIQREIATFAADPKNEFYSLVQEEVLAFVRQGLDLKPAYDKAIWANPVTRAKLIASQQETEQREAAGKAAAANRANIVNVTARATPQGKTAGKGTLDDDIRASMAEVVSRSA